MNLMNQLQNWADAEDVSCLGAEKRGAIPLFAKLPVQVQVDCLGAMGVELEGVVQEWKRVENGKISIRVLAPVVIETAPYDPNTAANTKDITEFGIPKKFYASRTLKADSMEISDMQWGKDTYNVYTLTLNEGDEATQRFINSLPEMSYSPEVFDAIRKKQLRDKKAKRIVNIGIGIMAAITAALGAGMYKELKELKEAQEITCQKVGEGKDISIEVADYPFDVLENGSPEEIITWCRESTGIEITPEAAHKSQEETLKKAFGKL